MNKIVKFENTAIDVQIIDGTPMFELYTVGMALGYARSNGKLAGEHGVHPENKVLFPYKSRIDKVCMNAEIQPVVRNAKPYITESQIYDLMLEARTDKCRTFRKWLTNEVLPELNRTGSYTMPKQEDKQLTFEEYNYFDKKYNGEYVLSTMDVSALTNINTTTISWYARAHLNGGVDYYFISGDKLREFKTENPKVSKLASGLTVFTKSGFEKICRAYNIKVDTPHPFIKAAFKPKAELEKKERKLNTLGFEVERAVILENPKIQEYIKEITGCLKAMETLLMLYNSDDLSIESAKRKADSICDIAAAITGKSVALYCTKLETKIVKY